MREAALHRSVAGFLRATLRPPAMFTTFPSGGGGRVRGAQLKAMGLKAGMPDILVLQPSEGGTQVCWIELKTRKGVLSPEQKVMHAALKSINSAVYVCRCIDDVACALIEQKFPLAVVPIWAKKAA